jgi:hypothetical protein
MPGIYGEEFFYPGDAELTIDGEDQDTSALDPDVVADAVANSRAMRLILDGGVLNGDFRTGPPRPQDPIGPDNPLPGWRYGGGTAATGAWDSPDGLTLYWREDDDGQGYGPHIECVADEAQTLEVYAERYIYIEQLVPIASRERVLMPRALCSYDGGSALLTYIEGTPYGLDGQPTDETVIAEQGFGGEASYASGGLQLHQQPVEAASVITPNHGGQFLLIRIMFYTNNWVLSPPESKKVYEVTNAKPALLMWSGGFGKRNMSQATGTNDNYWYDEDNSAITTAARGMIAWSTGWNAGIGLRSNAARTSGQYAVGAYSLSQGSCIGPAVDIDSAHDGFNADSVTGYLYARSRGPYYADTTRRTAAVDTQGSRNAGNTQWNIFSGGERLNVRGRSHGTGNFIPANTDSMAFPSFVMVIEDGASGDNF